MEKCVVKKNILLIQDCGHVDLIGWAAKVALNI
jgi:hypothetical protein